MNNEKFRQKYLDMITDIETSPYINIININKDFELVSENIIEKTFQSIEKYEQVKLAEYFKEYFFSSDELHLEWNFSYNAEDEEEYVGGEFCLLNLRIALLKEVNLEGERAKIPDNQKAFMKQLRVFEVYPHFGGDRYTAFRFVNDNPSPEIWYCNEDDQQYFRLSLNYAEYCDCLIDLRGVFNWQMLFVEEIKSLAGLELKMILPGDLEILQFKLEHLPVLFPKMDYSKYFQIFEDKFNCKLSPVR